jgi:hypothetical protein
MLQLFPKTILTIRLLPISFIRAVAIIFGWALFGFVVYQAYITPSPEVIKWNPFDILGVADVSKIALDLTKMTE